MISTQVLQPLARLAYPYGAMRRVLRGPSRGMRIVVEPGLGLTYVIGTDAAQPRFFRKVIAPGMTVVDVGANKGQMTLLFAALVGKAGRVIALEPAPREFSSLARNVRHNQLDHVDVLEVAAAEHARELTFRYAPGQPTQGKLAGVEPSYETAGAYELTVQGMPLDSLLARGVVPAVIKLDVEGGAASVLRGARRMIALHSPAIYAELHGPEEQAGIRDEVIARGYRVETLDGRLVADPTAGSFGPLWCWRPNAARGANPST